MITTYHILMTGAFLAFTTVLFAYVPLGLAIAMALLVLGMSSDVKNGIIDGYYKFFNRSAG